MLPPLTGLDQHQLHWEGQFFTRYPMPSLKCRT